MRDLHGLGTSRKSFADSVLLTVSALAPSSPEELEGPQRCASDEHASMNGRHALGTLIPPRDVANATNVSGVGHALRPTATLTAGSSAPAAPQWSQARDRSAQNTDSAASARMTGTRVGQVSGQDEEYSRLISVTPTNISITPEQSTITAVVSSSSQHDGGEDRTSVSPELGHDVHGATAGRRQGSSKSPSPDLRRERERAESQKARAEARPGESTCSVAAVVASALGGAGRQESDGRSSEGARAVSVTPELTGADIAAKFGLGSSLDSFDEAAAA